jgi:hypothetical protein
MLPEIPFFEGFWYFVAAMMAMIAWRIWGARVVAAVRRFEQRRRDADLQAYFDRMNPNAHFRQSVDQIGEATPAVMPLGPNDPRAVWNDTTFATREDAEAARWRHILTEARSFYVDLDRTYGNRIKGPNAANRVGDKQ